MMTNDILGESQMKQLLASALATWTERKPIGTAVHGADVGESLMVRLSPEFVEHAFGGQVTANVIEFPDLEKALL